MASTLSENNTDMGSLFFSLGSMITQNWENQNEKKIEIEIIIKK
jgi:hypothetical protein